MHIRFLALLAIQVNRLGRCVYYLSDFKDVAVFQERYV